MKKASIIIIFFLLIVSIFYIKMQTASYPPEKVLVDAFKSSGASAVSSELYVQCKIGAFREGKTGEALISDVLKNLGYRAANPVFTPMTGKASGAESDLDLGGGRRMHASIAEDSAGVSDDGYVTISILDSSPAPDLAGVRSAIEKAMYGRGAKPRFNSCITGYFPGKSDNASLNTACAKIFAEAGARKIEGIREGSLISVSAFSNAIREAVDDNGRKVNLNLALRYNSYENRTYLWLATPVIITEY